MKIGEQTSLQGRLRTCGFRVTPGRLAVADFLARAGRPVGTPELVRACASRTMDVATLYRTLAAFAEKGLVRTVVLHSRFMTYEWVHEGEKHHHHLVCRECGEIEEIPDCSLETVERHILKGSMRFSSIVSHSLEFFGVCFSCASKKKKSP